MRRIRLRTASVALPVAGCLILLLSAAPSHATLGIFAAGNGLKSLGMGGVSYSHATESTALSGNPAHALGLGNRFDIGSDSFYAKATATISGNELAADSAEKSDGQSLYFIPQAGFTRRLNDRWAFGITMLSAGLGPDYDGSPYARFGGNPDRTTLQLASTSVDSVLAYQVLETLDVGLSLNTGYQQFSAKGLEFLTDPTLSSSPGQVTDQGKDGVFTFGASLGVVWRINPWLTAGASYRSKNHNGKHKDYRGLIAGGGRLELPAIYGGGLSIRASPSVTIALEAQRYTYRSSDAFGNGLDRLEAGVRLGEENGPGFGYDDQNAYKLGVSYDVSPRLTLRGGYTYGTQMVTEKNTLFAFIGPVTLQEQYSVGATYRWQKWEMTGYSSFAPNRKVHGNGSIPAGFGGGESDIENEVVGAGISVGRRF